LQHNHSLHGDVPLANNYKKNAAYPIGDY